MQVSAGEYHTALLVSDGSAVACGDNEYGQCNLHRLPPLEAGLTYEQVSAGGCHTVSLRSDGMAVNCGNLLVGQTCFQWTEAVEITLSVFIVTASNR